MPYPTPPSVKGVIKMYGYFLNLIITISSFVVFGAMLMLLYQFFTRKLHPPKYCTRTVVYVLVFALVIEVIFSILIVSPSSTSDSTQSTKDTSTEMISSESSSDLIIPDSSSSEPDVSSSSDSISENLDNTTIIEQLTTKQRRNFNTGIDTTLNEDKSLYRQGKENFAWTVFVEKIEADKTSGFVVYVNNAFGNLNTLEAKTVINAAQANAIGQLAMMDIDTAPGYDPIFTSIRYNNTQIGQSKVLDQGDFKWNK